MNIDFYQQQAMRTSPADHDRVLNGCMGLIGESGELVDIIKKYRFQSLPGTELPKDEIVKECGDVLWYIAETASGLKQQLSSIISEEAEKTYVSQNTILEHEAMLLTELGCMIYKFCILHRMPDCAFPLLEDMYRHVAAILHGCGVSVDEAMKRNIEKLKKRYPDGFDAERSVNRDKYEHR